MMRYALNEPVRIFYEAKRLLTGLTDVKIDIYNKSGSKIIDQQTMSEFGSGYYYYDWLPTAQDSYLVVCDSATQPRLYNDTIVIFSSRSQYAKAMRQSSGSYVTGNDTWSKEEKSRLLDMLKEMQNRLDALESEIKKPIDISVCVDNYIQKLDDLSNNVTTVMEELNNRILNDVKNVSDEMNFKNETILNKPLYKIEMLETTLGSKINEISRMKQDIDELKNNLLLLGRIIAKSLPHNVMEAEIYGNEKYSS